jgi:pilus assembly protein Flp/PilA
MSKVNLSSIRLAWQQNGATMVEYAFMLVLIAIVSIAMITGLGQQTNVVFSAVNSAMVSANG